MIPLVSVLTFFIVNITNFPEDALSNDKVSSTTETNWGLHTTTFTTPEGKIKVNFPDDMAAGDTISGTVIAEPAGATLDERERNSDELNGYVVEVEKTKTPVIGKVLKWTVPAALVGGATYIILRDKDGKEVTRSEVPVIPTPPFEKPPTTPSSTDYSLPGVGQAGRPTQIVGIFDGDSNTTTVEIGGRNTRILAESPRKTRTSSSWAEATQDRTVTARAFGKGQKRCGLSNCCRNRLKATTN